MSRQFVSDRWGDKVAVCSADVAFQDATIAERSATFENQQAAKAEKTLGVSDLLQEVTWRPGALDRRVRLDLVDD
jgi:hypothetical protein